MDAQPNSGHRPPGDQIVTIFGGTGFIGRHVVRRLAKAGHTVKVATRYPESAYFLRPYGKTGQIVAVPCAYGDDAALAAAARGAHAVINCVGILAEQGRNTFRGVHAELPGRLARAATTADAAAFVHLSAIAPGNSRYSASKREGEAAVRAGFPDAVILRPSVVFGPEDQFFNRFARLAMLSPVLPLIGGDTKMQPVYVGDVADAVMSALRGLGRGGVFELGGPEVLTFREIYQRLFAAIGRRPLVAPVPFGLAKLQAAFLQILPNKPLTVDQVETLKTDTVVAAGARTLADLDVAATALDPIIRDYLTAYRRGGAFPPREAYGKGQP